MSKDLIYSLRTDLMEPEDIAELCRDHDVPAILVVPGKPRNKDGSQSFYFAVADEGVAERVRDLVKEHAPRDYVPSHDILDLFPRQFEGWSERAA